MKKMWQMRIKMRINQVARTVRETKENKYKRAKEKQIMTTNKWKGQRTTESIGIKKTK